ncbi:MAG: hypothetical protein ACFFBP_06980 [Promethearchaeota archaeon]
MTDIQKYIEIYEKYNTERKRFKIYRESENGYKIIKNETMIVYEKLKPSENERVKYLKWIIIIYIAFIIFFIMILGFTGGFIMIIIFLIVFGVFGLIIFGVPLLILLPKEFFILGPEALIYKRIIGGIKHYDLNKLLNVNVKYIPEHSEWVAGYSRDRRITVPAHDVLKLNLINKYNRYRKVSVNLINFKRL